MKWQYVLAIMLVLLPVSNAQLNSINTTAENVTTKNNSNTTIVVSTNASAEANVTQTTQVTNRTVTEIDREVKVYHKLPRLSNNDSSNTSVKSELSITSVRFKQLVESFQDFIHEIKLAFSMNEESKLEALEERNAKLQERQQEWVMIKQQMMAELQAGNYTPEEKQTVLREIQREHQKIIKEHVEVTTEIQEIQARAKAQSNVLVEQKATSTASAVAQSQVEAGLDIEEVELQILSEMSQDMLTPEEAEAIVSEEFGFTNNQVRTERVDALTVHVISGNETVPLEGYTLVKSYEVWVEASTGLIMKMDMDVSIVADGTDILVNDSVASINTTETTNETMNDNTDITVNATVETSPEPIYAGANAEVSIT